MEIMSIVMLVGVAIFAMFGVALVKTILNLRRVVPTNMVHIVQSSKKSRPYGRGKEAGNTYYAWPSWIPVIGVSVTQFPESIFQVTLSNYDAYDSNRLPFMVDVTAFFRVDEAEIAAQRVANFDELMSQLESVLQGSVRRILATNELEDIMQARATLGAQFTDEVKTQISEWGVLPVKTIEFMDIRDVRDSVVISNIMAKEKSRIDMESRVQVANNKQLAETKEIEAGRTVEVQRQDAQQQIGIRTAEKDRTVGIAKEQASQEILQSSRLTAERTAEVKRIQEVKQAEIQKDVAVVVAEQEKSVMIVNAEANRQKLVVTADGELEASKRNAEGIKVEGEARASAEQMMLMAPVNTQITLAKEIGSNEGYQQYLITIKQVDANREVGLQMANAFAAADLKVIANGGSMGDGVTNLAKMVSSAGGVQVAGLLEGLGQTDTGYALIQSIINRVSGNVSE